MAGGEWVKKGQFWRDVIIEQPHTMIELMFLKVLILIKQILQKSVLFTTVVSL